MHFPYRGHPPLSRHVVQNFLVVAAREFGAEVSREEDSRQTSDTIHNRIAASILHIVADNFYAIPLAGECRQRSGLCHAEFHPLVEVALSDGQRVVGVANVGADVIDEQIAVIAVFPGGIT